MAFVSGRLSTLSDGTSNCITGNSNHICPLLSCRNSLTTAGNAGICSVVSTLTGNAHSFTNDGSGICNAASTNTCPTGYC